MKLPIYQADAFTSHIFKGNPAAVVPLVEWLPDETLQDIAAENNLSETAFFVPEAKTTNRFHLRWLTPTVEVDLCGHATLAAAHVLFSEIGVDGDEIIFDSRSGKLRVTKKDRYRMDFPADPMPEAEAPAILFEALGISRQQSYKTDDYMVVLENEQEVAGINPDFRKLKEVNARGVIVTAACEREGVDFVSRFFAPQSGVDEDPVTGSAHTKLVPYWSEKLEKKQLVAEQISARGGRLYCTMDSPRVIIEGEACTYLRGHIFVG